MSYEQRAQKATDDLARRIGLALLIFERRAEQMDAAGIRLKSFKVKMPTEERSDYLIVTQAEGETGSIVGFSGGTTLAEALAGTVNRLYNGSMKWKEDQYG